MTIMSEHFAVRQAVEIAEYAQADAVALHGGELFAKEADQQLEEQADFILGAAPVFLREGVERQVADAERAALGHDGFGGADAGLMAFAAGQAAFLRPAAVAVHDDGNVGRERGGGNRKRGRFGHGRQMTSA